MSTAAVARLSAEQAQAARNDSGVQYKSEPNTYIIDAVVETELTVGTAKPDYPKPFKNQRLKHFHMQKYHRVMDYFSG